MFGWVRVSMDGRTYSHIHQPQKMSCGATSLAMLVWNCGYGLGSEIVARWTMRGVERERTGRSILSDPDPMDDIGTDEKRVAKILREYYGLIAKVTNAEQLAAKISTAPADWSSYVVGVWWSGGGGHLVTVIVRGANALIFDPGAPSGTIRKVACSKLVGGAAGARTLNVPGMAANTIDRAVEVPPQHGAMTFAKNLLQTPSWIYEFGRMGLPSW